MKVVSEWRGTVSLAKGRNYLEDSLHRFPLAANPIDGDNGELMIYLMSSSPGLFNGDRQSISCRVTEGAHLFLTDPSATELHPSLTDEESRQTQIFRLEKESTLEYVPQPLIPFKGSRYAGQTTLYMDRGAQAVVSEIITAGRVGRNEYFEYDVLTSRFEVYWEDQLLAMDSLRLSPDSEPRAKGILGPFTHMGTLWLLSEQIGLQHLRSMQERLAPEGESPDYYGGASLLRRNGMAVRLLGYSAEVLQHAMKDCWDYFRRELLHIAPLEI